MQGPVSSAPPGTLIADTWKDHQSGVILAETARLNAGRAGVIDVEDLTGQSAGVSSAWDERVTRRHRKVVP